MRAEEEAIEDADELDEVAGGARRHDPCGATVGAVVPHLHRRDVDRLQEKRREDLAERVQPDAALGIAESITAGAIQVDVDEPAAVHAERARVRGTLDDDADLIVLEPKITDLAERAGASHQIGAAVDEACPRPDLDPVTGTTQSAERDGHGERE
jgi:hypothetical protein